MTERTGSARPLWIGVGVLVVLTALAWTAMFVAAAKTHPEQIPVPAKAPSR